MNDQETGKNAWCGFPGENHAVYVSPEDLERIAQGLLVDCEGHGDGSQSVGSVPDSGTKDTADT
jgi:hypothetical protein